MPGKVFDRPATSVARRGVQGGGGGGGEGGVWGGGGGGGGGGGWGVGGGGGWEYASVKQFILLDCSRLQLKELA